MICITLGDAAEVLKIEVANTGDTSEPETSNF